MPVPVMDHANTGTGPKCKNANASTGTIEASTSNGPCPYWYWMGSLNKCCTAMPKMATFTRSSSRRKIHEVVAKTEQNVDDDASQNTMASTGTGTCQYEY